jgi:hypothetical protein
VLPYMRRSAWCRRCRTPSHIPASAAARAVAGVWRASGRAFRPRHRRHACGGCASLTLKLERHPHERVRR